MEVGTKEYYMYCQSVLDSMGYKPIPEEECMARILYPDSINLSKNKTNKKEK